MSSIKIIAAQINFLVGDLEGNAKRIIEETQKAIDTHQADCVVFPELSLSGYPPEDLLLRPHFYERTEKALQMILNAKLPTKIIVGYPERDDGNSYNKASVIDHGEIIATQTKHHLPNYTVFDEKRYFASGHGPCVFDINGIKAGVIICEDLWYPTPAVQAVEMGAELIISVNASPYDRNKARIREGILIDRTNEIHCPIIYVNLVGGQDELVFDGGSMVVDAQGKRILQASYFQEEQMLIEVEKIKPIHIKPQTQLPPRLSLEESLYKALVLGVRDYINKNKFPGAIIGMSGGIDSALTCTIAVDAIGPERVHGVMMPSRYSSDMSMDDAVLEAEALNIKYDVIPIEPIFTAFLESLAPLFKGTEPDTTEENLQARTRGTLLMALSNKFGSIVLTTGNKSEMSVGYATLYGDMAGGFSVLKDIPKTLVYRLAEYRNTISPVIPERVLTKAPSAELAEDQIDQDSLPPYSILDEILHKFIEEDKDPARIYSPTCDKHTVNRVVQMVFRNEYKRRQAPIGIRTTERAFGKDRRYPITSGYGFYQYED